MRIIFALAALMAGACSRAPLPPPTGLQAVVNGLSADGRCARVIPSQWSPSRPVPVIEGGGLAYRVFFFGRDGDPRAGFRFHQAEGDAEVSAGGQVLSCSRRAQAGAPFAPGGGKQEPLDTVLKKEQALFAATEDVGALFAAGRPLTDAEKKRVAEFAAAFADLSEAGHAADYRALNPAFWTWIQANGGRSPGAGS